VLKITFNETAAERRWILQGRLVAVWVDELRKSWKEGQKSQSQTRCIVDLNDVTFIDKKGERLLRAMAKQGAQFVASGVYIRHLLEQLVANGRLNVTGLLSCLLAGFLATVIYLFPPRTRPELPEFDAQRNVTLRTTNVNCSR
jgi:anti-anti-sigma regulatory factor